MALEMEGLCSQIDELRERLRRERERLRSDVLQGDAQMEAMRIKLAQVQADRDAEWQDWSDNTASLFIPVTNVQP